MAAHVVRIEYPIDRWVTILVIPAEPADLPQYISMSVLGILAHRGDWSRKLPTAAGMIWLTIGLLAAAGYYVYDLLLAKSLPEIVAIGGKSWQSLVKCTWEVLVCAGLGVGLLVLFSERLTQWRAQPSWARDEIVSSHSPDRLPAGNQGERI